MTYCNRLMLLAVIALSSVASSSIGLSPSFAADNVALPSSVEEVEVVYKTIDGRELKYWLYQPTKAATKSRPAILFFHGGGWTGGNHTQFRPHAIELAQRGVVTVSAEYRLTKRDDCKVVDCLADAWDAYRVLCSQAGRWKLDPSRIAVGGGSAGGHLAACIGTGVYSPLDTTHTGDPRPAAMFLFNPAVGLAPFRDEQGEAVAEPSPEKKQRFQSILGCEAIRISPIHHVDEHTCPTVVFHGDADTTVPIRSVQAFCNLVERKGGEAILHAYPGRKHAFFNYNRNGASADSDYANTMVRLVSFLEARNWID